MVFCFNGLSVQTRFLHDPVCKCSQNLYQSVAIRLKYVLLVLLLCLLKYLGL